MSQLSHTVFVTPPIPQHTGTLNLPNGDPIAWSPLSTTLIYGDHDAVLVDPPFTTATVRDLLAEIELLGRRITDVYITHGHGDHWFGTSEVLRRFPEARVRATAGTRAHMTSPGLAEARASFWDALFPGEIPNSDIGVDVVGDSGFTLEGHDLLPVEVGHSDSDDTTVLWVPELRLAVAGDVVYNGVHLSLGESANGGRDAWRNALTAVTALNPAVVVAGHKNPANPDSPSHIDATRRYLDDVDEQLAAASSPLEYYESMLRLHGARLNPGVLWVGANALLGGDAG